MDRDYAVERLKTLKKNNQLFSEVCNFAIKNIVSWENFQETIKVMLSQCERDSAEYKTYSTVLEVIDYFMKEMDNI